MKPMNKQLFKKSALQPLIYWALFSALFASALQILLIPDQTQLRAQFLNTLAQSHHSNLKVYSAQSIRDELVKNNIISSDKDFEQYTFAYEQEKILSLLKNCEYKLPSLCSNKRQIVILVGGNKNRPENSDAVLVLESTFMNLTDLFWFWTSIGAIFAALVILAGHFSFKKTMASFEQKLAQETQEKLKYRKWINAKAAEPLQMKRLSYVAHDIRSPIKEAIDLNANFPSLYSSLPQDELASLQESLDTRLKSALDTFEAALKNKLPDFKGAEVEDLVLGFIVQAKNSRQLSSLKLSAAIAPDVASRLPDLDLQEVHEWFWSLCQNANEAGATSVWIEAENASDENFCTIKVIDNGSGISKSMKNDLFTEYATSKQSGTGLGLASIKDSLRKRNGKIELIDNDEGTTFALTIPFKETTKDA